VTVEALAYSLRSGPTVLTRDDVRRRLHALNREQLADMCIRARRRWREADVQRLIEAWRNPWCG
jgi:hypothetical protein